jgi:hypothetical protein
VSQAQASGGGTAIADSVAQAESQCGDEAVANVGHYLSAAFDLFGLGTTAFYNCKLPSFVQAVSQATSEGG